jgi:hypothetical protein
LAIQAAHDAWLQTDKAHGAIPLIRAAPSTNGSIVEIWPIRNRRAAALQVKNSSRMATAKRSNSNFQSTRLTAGVVLRLTHHLTRLPFGNALRNLGLA